MQLRGRVKKGLKIGQELGYPTANLVLESGSLPAPGVYVAQVMKDYHKYKGVAVIGARYEGNQPLLEVHLLDFTGDLYGEMLEVEIYEKLSDIDKLEHHLLVKKIEADIKKAREYFMKHVT